MSHVSDDDIRSRFDALRTAERASTPNFRALVEGAAHPGHPGRPGHAGHIALPRVGWRTGILLSLAAAAAVLLTVDAAHHAARLREFMGQPLATWTSPTAALLNTSGSTLLASPLLMPSVLDGLTSPTHP